MPASLRSEINVTPLVDIVLVLLIVFITLVPALPRALAAVLPRPGPPGTAPAPLRLVLSADGAVGVEGRPGIGWEDALRGCQGRLVLKVPPELPLSVPAGLLDRIQGVRPGAKVTLVPLA